MRFLRNFKLCPFKWWVNVRRMLESLKNFGVHFLGWLGCLQLRWRWFMEARRLRLCKWLVKKLLPGHAIVFRLTLIDEICGVAGYVWDIDDNGVLWVKKNEPERREQLRKLGWVDEKKSFQRIARELGIEIDYRGEN